LGNTAKGFGYFSRESGQSREPDPPLMITGIRGVCIGFIVSLLILLEVTIESGEIQTKTEMIWWELAHLMRPIKRSTIGFPICLWETKNAYPAFL
jgi:hypothetical protein